MTDKSASPRMFLGLAAVIAALQTAALAYIVVSRDCLLKTGREIVLNVVPLDPRDLLRGDYVTLGYDITRVTGQALGANGEVPQGIERGGEFYAVLQQQADAWSVKRVAATYPADVGADEAVIKGRVRHIYDAQLATTDRPAIGSTLFGRYGIETYFVPEGTGKELEEKVRSQSIKAIVALGPDGTAALKGLIVDGARRELPPIF